MDNKEKLEKLIYNLFNYRIPKENFGKSMFLEPMSINARNFFILFMEIEKEFSIRIPDNLILERKIDTFDSMLGIINRLSAEE